MNQQSIENARDPDLRLSLPAIRRAAQRAHELAAQTGTLIVISRDGVIELITPTPDQGKSGVREPATDCRDKT